MELQAKIVHHLRGITEPCNVVELAHALGILEPGDVVPERLRSTLTGLVRHQQIKRIHNGDGVLRYSLAGAGQVKVAPVAPPPVSPAPAVTRAPAPTTASHHRRDKGVSARVLAAFIAGEDPIRRTTIESRITPPLTTTQVVMALQALRLKGKVVRLGTTSTATWALAGDEAAAMVAAIPANHLAVRLALLQARQAVDAALQALEA